MRIAGRFNTGLFIKGELILNPPDEMPKTEEDLLSDVFLKLLRAHRELGDLLGGNFRRSKSVVKLQ